MDSKQKLTVDIEKAFRKASPQATLTELVCDFEGPSETVMENEEEPEPAGRKRLATSPLKPNNRKRRFSSHVHLAKTAVGLRDLAKKIGEASLQWEATPKRIMLVTKIYDVTLISLTIDLASWLMSLGMTVY